MIPAQEPFTPWLEVYDRVQREWEDKCSHDQVVIGYKINKAKQRSFWRQCNGCGKLLGQIGRDYLTTGQIDAAQPYDRERETLRSQSIMTEARERYHKAIERRSSTMDFWERYETYIKTRGWQIKRQKVLTRAKGMCEGCGDRPAVQVHHLTYDRLGDEMLFDLVAVCISCHERIHNRRLA